MYVCLMPGEVERGGDVALGGQQARPRGCRAKHFLASEAISSYQTAPEWGRDGHLKAWCRLLEATSSRHMGSSVDPCTRAACSFKSLI